VTVDTFDYNAITVNVIAKTSWFNQAN
jgi:hypothetical protein